MGKLYREFFQVTEHEKIREKVILTRITVTVAIIIFCLAAMGFSAYAYFTHDVISSSNVIKTANFATSIDVNINDANGEAISVITSNYKSHTAELSGGKTYLVTVTPAATSTAQTGFIILTAEGNTNRYHTQQLGKDGDMTREVITFYIEPTNDTCVTFFSHWGTSSYYGYSNTEHELLYITDGETVEITVTKEDTVDESLDSATATPEVTPSPTTDAAEPEATTPAPETPLVTATPEVTSEAEATASATATATATPEASATPTATADSDGGDSQAEVA